ncbi:MAG: phosphoglycolate phosphatase [Burkholderiaceae bacterium]|nr:phosphoglycolate phosphatase [Burkholderiaceae bacterium]
MKTPTLSLPRAILFDLDGTLADSAPDLAAAVNLLRTERGLEPAPYEKLRAVASAGARGLIGAAFNLTPEDDGYPELLKGFLDNYQSALMVNSSLFDGISSLLQGVCERGMPWGIVTNKFARFTTPLVAKIGLHQAACVISGDTTPHSKPHPAPLLEAARVLSIAPQHCWYVGDDLRDIQAGRAAGMMTLVAGWGYCDQTQTASWGADRIMASPQQLLELVRQTALQAA